MLAWLGVEQRIRALAPYVYQSRANVTCDEHYQAGGDFIECKATGEWTEVPRCILSGSCGILDVRRCPSASHFKPNPQ